MFGILLILVFIRPFISSLTYISANFIYSILLLGFLALWIITKGVRLDGIKPIRYPFILFILALLISLIFSQDKITSVKELYKYVTAIIIFLVAIALSSKDKGLLVRCIVLTGIPISLLAIYQYFFGFQLVADYLAKENISNIYILDYVKQKRVFLPFVTSNVLGGYLAMIISLSLTQKNRVWLIIPLAFALLLTRSIGGFLSLLLGLVIYLYLQGKLGKRGILSLFVLTIFILSVLITRSADHKQHVQPIFSTAMRLNYWKDALIIIKTAPLTGVGLGNFNIFSTRFAHNSYLQIWAEMGILGLISILWLIIATFKSGLKDTESATRKNQSAGLVAAGTVFLIHNFVEFSFFLPEVALIWWVILGLTISKEKE